MKNNLDKSIAASLETELKMLPFMPYLLQDLWEMGCAIGQILNIIAELKLPTDKMKILDLGCGKGAVSIQIAEKFGFQVTGIDAMPVFLTEARRRAEERKVDLLCDFIEADIVEYVKQNRAFHVVILASLGGVLGNIKQTVEKLRGQVAEDGFIIIDDGYLKRMAFSDRQGYQHYRNYETSVKELTACADDLIIEKSTSLESQQINNYYLEVIRQRGGELASRHPKLAGEIDAYIKNQEAECVFLEQEIEGAVWVLQKKV